MFDVTRKPNSMSFEDSVEELSTLNGITIGHLDGKPEIFFSSKTVAAFENARYAMMQPERQETTYEKYNEGYNVELHAQCNSCGNPCALEDNFCSCCGRRFRKEKGNGCPQE
jgi:hypothetical protein